MSTYNNRHNINNIAKKCMVGTVGSLMICVWPRVDVCICRFVHVFLLRFVAVVVTAAVAIMCVCERV